MQSSTPLFSRRNSICKPSRAVRLVRSTAQVAATAAVQEPSNQARSGFITRPDGSELDLLRFGQPRDQNRQQAVLVLQGTACPPNEDAPKLKHLADRHQLMVYAPIIPDPAGLPTNNNVKAYQDAYYQDIRLAYQKLREECGAECDVMLLGYSLGALTALRLVKDCPNDTYAGVLCICPITEPLSWSLSELSELSRESQLSVMIMYSRLDVVSYPWDVETRLIQPLKSNQRLEVTDVQLQAGLHTTVLAATLFRFSRFPAWLRRLTKDRLEIGVVLALFALVEAVLLARVWEVMPVFPGALGTHVAATLAVGVGMEASIMIFAWRGIDATIFDVDRWLDAFVTGIYRQGIETEF